MKKCMGCMRDYEEAQVCCPVCGYSKKQMEEEALQYPEALPPETILDGRFILGRILSAGDFSMVYIAWDALLQKRVAIREYMPSGFCRRRDGGELFFDEEQKRLHFERGLQVFTEEAGGLNRNQDIEEIVSVYRVIRANGTAYLVMEYVEGCTLRDVIDEIEMLPETQADHMIHELAEMLDKIHARGICHFNLSPDNIYIDKDAKIRILDFGKAKYEMYRMVKGNMTVLDPRYSAPEILRKEEAGYKADIYSLGAVFYRIATGKEPPVRKGYRKKKKGLRANGAPAGKAIEKMTMPDQEKRPHNAVQQIEQICKESELTQKREERERYRKGFRLRRW